MRKYYFKIENFNHAIELFADRRSFKQSKGKFSNVEFLGLKILGNDISARCDRARRALFNRDQRYSSFSEIHESAESVLF